MKKPLNKRFAGFVKLGAGVVAAAAVIAATVRGSALSRGAVVSESLPSESIVITSAVQPSAVSLVEPTDAPSTAININTATAEELQTLPGIGAAKAAAIVEYRENHGAFADVSEITNVSGIGETIFGQIRGKITVGEKTTAPSSNSVGEQSVVSSSALININTATTEELQTLPRIGAAKAAAIVEYRENYGAFADVSEITNVSGIGETIFGQIRGKITVGEKTTAPSSNSVGEQSVVSSSALLNINTATAEELQTLPGIGAAKAAAIIEYRERFGEFTDISEITNVSGIGNATFERIRYKISV